MKITKQQLKQIVKEEIPKILSEASPQSELGLPHKFDNKELYKIGRQQWRDPDSQLRTDREYAAKFVAQISNKLRKGGASPGLEALRHDIESSFTPSLDTLQSRRHAKDQKFRPQSRLRQRTGAYSSRSPGPDEPLSVYEDMKITKSQLKQIVKEEIIRLGQDEFGNLAGAKGSEPSSGAHINAALEDIWTQMKKDGTIDTIWVPAAIDIQNAAGEDTPARADAIKSVKNHIQTVAAEIGNPPQMIEAIVELAVRHLLEEGGE